MRRTDITYRVANISLHLLENCQILFHVDLFYRLCLKFEDRTVIIINSINTKLQEMKHFS